MLSHTIDCLDIMFWISLLFILFNYLFYRDYFILHPNQVICRVWSLRLFYRLSLWLAYMLYAKIVMNKSSVWMAKNLEATGSSAAEDSRH